MVVVVVVVRREWRICIDVRITGDGNASMTAAGSADCEGVGARAHVKATGS